MSAPADTPQVHLIPQALLPIDLRRAIENAAARHRRAQRGAPPPLYRVVFWVMLEVGKSALVFTRDDGACCEDRARVVPGRTLVFLMPKSKDAEGLRPFRGLRPAMIQDAKLKQCHVEVLSHEDVERLCTTLAFPNTVATLLATPHNPPAP